MADPAPLRRGPGRPAEALDAGEVRQLLQGLAEGLSDAAIGRRLNPARPPSGNAVKLRIYRLMRRWGALNRPHLMSLAYRRGVLTVDTPRGTVEALRAGAVVAPNPELAARPPGQSTTRKAARG